MPDVPAAIAPILAAIAVVGLPQRESPAPIALDDATFDALLAAAASEHVTGHLVSALSGGRLAANDEQVAQAGARHEQALATDLTLERVLASTSARFTEAGIRHRALKGPVLARTVYPDPSLRSFGDVDLLVAGDDFDRAVELLASEGGAARYREPRRGFTARYGKGVCVVTAGAIEIDLHRAFVAGPFGLAIDPHDLFAAPEVLDIGGARVPAPSLEVRFLHACYHVALTNPRLTALRDVAQIVMTTDLDHERVLEIATRWRGRAVVQRALVRTAARLPIATDHPWFAWAARYRPDRFERNALRPYTDAGASYAAQMAMGWWALRGVRPRIEYTAALLVPDRNYLGERDGSYPRRWRRALDLARGRATAPAE
jgi:hypothetical protein